jgi:hypothetical protein
VYEFVTTPANWVGTHPVTAAVKGDTDTSAGVGRHWIEVIQADGGEPFETEWTVVQAEPGKTWVIASDQLQVPSMRCEITYTFTQQGDATDFRREMVTSFPDDGAVTAELYARLEDPARHADYLAKVKAALER